MGACQSHAPDGQNDHQEQLSRTAHHERAERGARGAQELSAAPSRQARLGARYKEVMEKAQGWLMSMPLYSPTQLRDHQLKGMKKYVEQLDTYRQLYKILPTSAAKAQMLERLNALAKMAKEPSFHQMMSVDDAQFKQDATSYMRAAFLLERLGLGAPLYREELAKIKPRLDAHLSSRGSHQRMAFALYYRHFGMSYPEDAGVDPTPKLINSRKDPYEYTKLEAYDLTHEIFVPFEFGDKLDVTPFDEEEKRYISRALDRLTVHYIMRKDPDLVAELILCMRYLGMTSGPIYEEGLSYLLASQNPDSSWGNYKRHEERYGSHSGVAIYLHTVMVVLAALTLEFGELPS